METGFFIMIGLIFLGITIDRGLIHIARAIERLRDRIGE